MESSPSFRLISYWTRLSIMTTAMTLRRLGCALCMPFISPFRSPFRPYNRAYAYRGLTASAPLSIAVSECGYPRPQPPSPVAGYS
ncbi:MAG: hypothetical protein KZQ60_01550 [Candidatus Thiodiazotropha sp. (ex Lucinoma aequizonata)]|nr:hypothetical protein [Candidatus Thiodiazotropha sp. (ex Lucinoma aequizonata)]